MAKKEKKDKYARAADKNLETFLENVAGDLMGGVGDDDDESEGSFEQGSMPEEDDEESDAYSEPESDPPPQKKKRKSSEGGGDDKPKAKRKPRKSKGKEGQVFKSAEFIDSDDSSSNEGVTTGDKVEKPEASTSTASEKTVSKKRKSKDGDDAKKEKKVKAKKESDKPKKVKKEAPRKEGDADKGSAEEEERIKKLKALLTAAEGPRAFNQSTGAERTLTASVRIARLESLLNDLGLKVKGGGGALPSMSKATALGQKRALQKEMEEISGVPRVDGLRDGKKRVSTGGHGSDDDDDDPAASKKESKPFGAFLSGVQSDSD